VRLICCWQGSGKIVSSKFYKLKPVLIRFVSLLEKKSKLVMNLRHEKTLSHSYDLCDEKYRFEMDKNLFNFVMDLYPS